MSTAFLSQPCFLWVPGALWLEPSCGFRCAQRPVQGESMHLNISVTS